MYVLKWCTDKGTLEACCMDRSSAFEIYWVLKQFYIKTQYVQPVYFWCYVGGCLFDLSTQQPMLEPEILNPALPNKKEEIPPPPPPKK